MFRFVRFDQPSFDWLGRRAGAVMATDSLSRLSRKHSIKVGDAPCAAWRRKGWLWGK